MSPEKQRIEIAKACGYKHEGWAPHSDGKTHPVMLAPCGARTFYWMELPDYLNDLNAMHEAENILNAQQKSDILCWLWEHTANHWEVFHSTAAQRAEAFLRTLNLWEEE